MFFFVGCNPRLTDPDALPILEPPAAKQRRAAWDGRGERLGAQANSQGLVSEVMNRRRRLVGGWCATGLLLVIARGFASAGEALPQEATQAAIDKAIATVYPALVQIQVVSLGYDDGRERKFQAAGSGVVISAEGHVVTNHHVVGRTAAIRAVLSTREEIDAALVGTDPLADIAVVKLELASRRPGAPPLVVARFGDSDALEVGEPVLAMGCPLALSQSVTRGIISNKDLMMPSMYKDTVRMELDGEDVGSLVKWLGHDAQIFPGNSGGPLVNIRGEIVGVNELGIGLGGAIPSAIARPVAEELIAHGRVSRAWVGVALQPQLKAAGDGPVRGVLVAGVFPGSPAEAAGIQAGDVVVAVDGQPVQARFQQELPALNKLILSKPVGRPIEFKIARGGKELTLRIVGEPRDEAKGRDSEVKAWGLTVRRLSRIEAGELRRPDQAGVLVGSVRPGGPADQAQPPLASGDVIVAVDGKPVPDVQTLLKVTAEITRGAGAPVPALVTFDHKAEHCLTVVELGIRRAQMPPAEVEKAWLPVATQVLSRKLAKALDQKGRKGVRITAVYPESVAAAAGLREGDILTHVDDVAIEASEPQDAQVFETMLRAYAPGSKPEFTVVRGKEILKIPCTLAGAPKTERELKTYEDHTFEFKARDVTFMDRFKRLWSKHDVGALVTEADHGGWAAVGGLRADDLILALDGRPVSDVENLEALLAGVRQARPRQVVFLVRRGVETRFVELEPQWPQER